MCRCSQGQPCLTPPVPSPPHPRLVQDCVTPHLGYNLKNANCSGGYMADVFAFAAANGTATESLYPYTGKNVTGCKASMLAGGLKQRPQGLVKTGAAAPGYLRVPQGRTGMLKAIAQQPVAAYMAIDPTFQVSGFGWVGGAVGAWCSGEKALESTRCCQVDTAYVCEACSLCALV